MSKIMFSKIDLEGVKGVLIDIDNTLYAYEPVHQIAIKACYNLFVKEITGKTSLFFEQFYNKYRQKRKDVTERLKPQSACRSRLFAFQAMFEEMNLKHAFNQALEFEGLYWNTLIKNMQLCEGAEKFLKECEEKEIKICAVSDMQAHFQIQKLQALKVNHLIDYLVTSEEVGAEKPAGIMFETALKKLQLNPEEVIMVGDNEEKDIQGATVLGIKSFLVEFVDD